MIPPVLEKAEAALSTFGKRFPEVTEDYPWGHRTLKVRGKAFVFFSLEDGSLSFSVKLPKSNASALLLPFAQPTGYGLGKSGWVTARFGAKDRVPLAMVQEWIEESYRAVAPKRVVASLDAAPRPAGKLRRSEGPVAEAHRRSAAVPAARQAMTGHVALLRGINVGKAKRIAMAELKRLMETLGYTDVTTLLNSGNVVFRVPSKMRGDQGPRIQNAIAERLGVASRVTVLSGSELRAIVDANPLVDAADDPSRLYVAILADPKDRKKLLALEKQDWSPEHFALGQRAAYLWLARGVIDSPLSKAFERTMKDAATARNVRTMGKIVALADRDRA